MLTRHLSHDITESPLWVISCLTGSRLFVKYSLFQITITSVSTFAQTAALSSRNHTCHHNSETANNLLLVLCVQERNQENYNRITIKYPKYLCLFIHVHSKCHVYSTFTNWELIGQGTVLFSKWMRHNSRPQIHSLGRKTNMEKIIQHEVSIVV